MAGIQNSNIDRPQSVTHTQKNWFAFETHSVCEYKMHAARSIGFQMTPNEIGYLSVNLPNQIHRICWIWWSGGGHGTAEHGATTGSVRVPGFCSFRWSFVRMCHVQRIDLSRTQLQCIFTWIVLPNSMCRLMHTQTHIHGDGIFEIAWPNDNNKSSDSFHLQWLHDASKTETHNFCDCT